MAAELRLRWILLNKSGGLRSWGTEWRCDIYQNKAGSDFYAFTHNGDSYSGRVRFDTIFEAMEWGQMQHDNYFRNDVTDYEYLDPILQKNRDQLDREGWPSTEFEADDH